MTALRTSMPDPGQWIEAAVKRIEIMLDQGADIVDIGACSTRPGAQWPSADEEWKRLEPVLRKAKEHFPDTTFSIDTFRPEIVEKAYSLIGYFWINDIMAGNYDKAMLSLAASLDLPWIAMHQEPYEGPEGIARFFQRYARQLTGKGSKHSSWIRVGFHKDVDQNFQVMEALPSLVPKNHEGEPAAPCWQASPEKE